MKLNIELGIFHLGKLIKYDVVELFQDNDMLSYGIFHKGKYEFTLVPSNPEWLSFELSEYDKLRDIKLDWDIYSKIEASLYSMFLNDPAS